MASGIGFGCLAPGASSFANRNPARPSCECRENGGIARRLTPHHTRLGMSTSCIPRPSPGADTSADAFGIGLFIGRSPLHLASGLGSVRSSNFAPARSPAAAPLPFPKGCGLLLEISKRAPVHSSHFSFPNLEFCKDPVPFRVTAALGA